MATTSVEPVEAAAPDPRFELDEIVGYSRSASDVMRLLVYSSLALFLLALTRWAESAVLGLESDIISLLGFLEPPAERVIEGATAIVAFVVSIGVIATPFVLRRYRILLYLIVGNLVSTALINLALSWLDHDAPRDVVNQLAQRAGVQPDQTLTPSVIANFAASFVILAPFVGARWRRAGAIIITAVALLRIVLSVELPADVFLALAIGAFCGAAVLLALGRPDQHPTMAAVAASLAAAGLSVGPLEPIPVGRRALRAYVGTLSDGSRIVAKVRSPAERSADLLFRIYRYLRLKNVGDEKPFISLRRAVEHEALVALQARDVGVSTPRMRAIASVGTDSMILAFDHVDGHSLDHVDDLSDDSLRALWQQLAILREHRIAHRDLRRSNILIGDDGTPWLIDFGFSEVAVDDAVLDADVAQLLASLTLQVGVTRAVDSAIATLGVDALRSSLRLLQLNAFSGATRAAFRAHKGLLKELQTTVAERCAVEQVQYVPLARLDKKALFTIVMLVLVTYFLLPQVANLPGIIDQVEAADWIWFLPVVLASMLTYFGATLGVIGSVPDRLRLIPTFIAQIAASFAGTLAPAMVGGMALNVRFLQKSGVDPAVAVPAVGLNAITGIAVHIGMLVLFVVWAGRSAFKSIHLPDPEVLLYGVGAVLVLTIGSFAIPAVRRVLRERLVPVLKRSMSGLAAVVRSPTNIALLLGGSVLVTTGYIVSLFLATLAFGGELSFAQVGAIYLVGAAIGSAAPTPGGLGALEAALIAGLVAAGMSNDIAVPTVFLFRLATFWLPILPGWGAFHYLRKEDYL